MPRLRVPAGPCRYFNSSPEVIRLAVLLYVKYPVSLRNVEDLLAIARLQGGDDRAWQYGQAGVERWANNRVENSHQSAQT